MSGSGRLSASVGRQARVFLPEDPVALYCGAWGRRPFTLKKLECSKQAYA
jgi:hypothetical protein